MRNVCSLIAAILFSLPAMAIDKKKPDLKSRLPVCQENLAPPDTQPNYGNTDEQDGRRIQPGPDEIEDRNPDEVDAVDPGH